MSILQEDGISRAGALPEYACSTYMRTTAIYIDGINLISLGNLGFLIANNTLAVLKTGLGHPLMTYGLVCPIFRVESCKVKQESMAVVVMK